MLGLRLALGAHCPDGCADRQHGRAWRWSISTATTKRSADACPNGRRRWVIGTRHGQTVAALRRGA